MRTTTNTNTFFGIIAALIAVIFTLAAFTVCTNPAEETEPVDPKTIDLGKNGLHIYNHIDGKTNAELQSLADKICFVHDSFKDSSDSSLDNYKSYTEVTVILSSVPSNLERDGTKLTLYFDFTDYLDRGYQVNNTPITGSEAGYIANLLLPVPHASLNLSKSVRMASSKEFAKKVVA
jgi:hypothetical protein